MSQRARRPKPIAPQRRKASATTNKSQRLMAIFAILVVVSLVGTIVGPPVVDYLTRPDDEIDVSTDDSAEDPVEQEYLADIQANPDDPAAHAALGNYLGNTGRVDEAIPYFERALELAPEDWDIRLGFARVLANGKKRADAELQFKKVIAARPTDPQAYFSLGQLYANWVPARTDEAIAAYQKTIEFGADTFVAQRATEELSQLGAGTPAAVNPPASPVAPEATP